MTYSAILFDCDGVLVDSEKIYAETEREYLAQIGLKFTLEDYQHKFTGLTSTDFEKQVQREYVVSGQGNFPADFFTSLETAAEKRMDEELQPIAGIKRVLDELKHPKAVASSSRLKSLIQKLNHTGLYDYFAPHVYSGEQVENGKPAPDVFFFAAEKLGTLPAECLVIEDSINGVRAGRAAGMSVIGFAGGSHANPALSAGLLNAGARQVIDTHNGLGQFLNQIR